MVVRDQVDVGGVDGVACGGSKVVVWEKVADANADVDKLIRASSYFA